MKRSIGFITGGATYLLTAVSALAQGVGQPIKLVTPPQSLTDVPLQNIPQFLITLLFVIGIIIAVVFLIYGGIKWILSGGDKTAVESARNHIIAAIVGLIIVVAAFLILNVVFTIITGSKFDLNNLCIPTLQNPTCK